MNKNKNLLDSKNTIIILNLSLIVFFFLKSNKFYLIASIIICILSLVSNKASILIWKIWNKISYLLGLITPNILLTIIFYFILFPISFLNKIFTSEDNLHLKNNCSSLFKLRNKEFYKIDFEKTW